MRLFTFQKGYYFNEHILVSFQPYFLSINGTLLFYYFEAGTNPIAFEPSRLQRRLYLGQDRGWSSAEAWGQESEVAWQYHVQDGDNLGYTIRYICTLEYIDIKFTPICISIATLETIIRSLN